MKKRTDSKAASRCVDAASAKHFKEWMIALGYSKADAAREFGLTTRSISRILRGDRPLRPIEIAGMRHTRERGKRGVSFVVE